MGWFSFKLWEVLLSLTLLIFMSIICICFAMFLFILSLLGCWIVSPRRRGFKKKNQIQLSGAPFDFLGAWKLGSGKMAAKFFFFFLLLRWMKFSFLVSMVGEVFFFKNYHFATGFWSRVEFFFLRCLWQRSFFFTPQVSEVFFLVSTAGEVFFLKKLPCPPLISDGVPLMSHQHILVYTFI